MLFQISLTEEQTNLDVFAWGEYELPSYNNDCETIEDDAIEAEIASFFESLESYDDLTTLPESILARLEGKRIRVYGEDKAYRDGGRFTFSVLNGIASVCRYYINSNKDDAYEYTWLFQDKSKYEFWNSRVQEGLNTERLYELKSAIDALKFNGMTVDSIISQIKKWEVM